MAEPYRPRVDPRVGIPIPQARPVPNALALVGTGLADVAERTQRSVGQLQQQLDHEEHAWLSSTLATARAEWSVTLAERKAGAPPGATGFKDGLLKDFDAWAEKTVGEARGRAQGELAARLKIIRADLMGDALAFETAARADWAKEQVKGSLEAGRTAVFAAPQHYESALGEQLSLLAKSTLPEPVKAGLERQIREGMTEAYVAARVERDPAGMMKALGPGQSDPIVSQLSLDDRRRLYGKAEAETRQRAADARAEMGIKLQLEERAARQAEKAERKAREESELKLTLGILSGEATAREVVNAGRSRLIGADQVRTLLSVARQESEGADDWRIAADLRIRASSGEDVLRDALQARQAGAISNVTLGRITEEVEQQRRMGGPLSREEVKTARSQLRETLLEGQNAFTGIKAPTAEKVAAADDMFRRRLLADPEADPAKLRDQVLATFRGGAMDESALPRSRFLVGTVRAPDVPATIDALNRALAAGRITRAEFLNEAEAIEAIGKFAASQPAKPAAPAQPAPAPSSPGIMQRLFGQ